ELALKKGSLMNPAAIGFLASLGIHEVDVYRQPKLCLLITGNELVEAGSILSHGQIYESNGLMLRSALRKSGFETIEIIRVNDDYRETREALRNALSGNDFLLVSGGISVGDYDFVGKALIELGVEELFYKVKQKPGKPLFFGRTSSAYVFALPGNPASALSCFYIYVLKALHMFKGNHRFTLNRVMAKSKSHFKKHGDRPQFLKAFYNNGQVEILDGQNSSMLHTFGVANALVFISAEQIQTDINDEVEVILLPNT
ncbi:MAG: molybdopterin molybdotransferase MoeA, partial [Flavobacteriaceae bacterium]|nr:molybdopterin molybdotransferase MoeA [Flavobacteriaceae bacterium]